MSTLKTCSKPLLYYLPMLFILFSSTSYSQWWVDGGNVIWPYGNVTITKGDVSVTKGVINVDSTITGDSLNIDGNASISGNFNVSGYIKSANIFSFLASGCDITIDNTAYELVVSHNEIGTPVTSIKWDSTYNCIKISFDNSSLYFHDYYILPNRIIARADTGSGWFSCAASVSIGWTPNPHIKFKFYNLDNEVQFDESNLVKVCFPIDLKFILSGSSDPTYQYLSTY